MKIQMPRTSICVVAATLAIAGVAGCGNDEADNQTASAPSGSDAPAAEEAEQTEGSSDAVDIVEFEFAPEEITVAAGTTVEFLNQDTAAHTATADDSSFDTEELGKGDASEITFDDPGTYSYYCRFHVFMKGSVVVE